MRTSAAQIRRWCDLRHKNARHSQNALAGTRQRHSVRAFLLRMPDLAAVCERALIEGYALVGSFVQYGNRPHFSRSR